MKKHTIAKRAAAFALAAVMAAGLFGCGEEAASGAGSAAASGGGGSASGTGRWRQEEVTPGENARSYEKPVLLEDGSLLLLEKGGDNTVTLWTSTDNGATWQEQPTDWAQQTGADYFGVTRLMPDGGCFITAVTEADGGYDQTWWVQDAGSATLRQLALPESILDVSDLQPLGSGQALLLGRILVPATEDAPSALVDENGMMSAMSAWKLDLATGECTEMTELLGGLEGSYISGIAADPTEPGAFYSLSYQESGVHLMRTGTDGAMTTVFENLPDASAAAFAACADSDGNYYYASQKGIYRLAKGGDLAELVVDGAGTVLSAGEASLMGLTRCADGSFLAVSLESSSDPEGDTAYSGHVYRLFWDETAPARGSGEALVVWSLENSNTVRAAINEYETQYPERTVDYQIALESGSSTADAITALNTALLAGSGPDVVILDGLDWQVYQEQGLLENLSAWVDTQSLVSNVAAPFIGQDGSVYALPARFAVPVLVGTESDLAAASSLESLAGWLLEKAARPAWDLQSNDYYEPLDEPYGLGFISIQQLLDFALETSAPALTENGVNGEAVAQVLDFVQQVGAYYGMDGYKNLMTNAVVAGEAGGEAVAYGDGGYECFFTHNAAMAWDTMTTPAYVAAARSEGDGYTVALRPGLCEGAFLPKAMAGISATSANKDEAGQFVAVLFGDAVQSTWQQDGMPVRADALESSINACCKKDETKQNVRQIVDALKTPVTMPDETVSDALLKNATALIEGKTTLDQAQAGVEDALKLYLAEQQ